MNIRNSNGYAAFIVLSVIAVVFIAFYVMMAPYANLFSRFTDDTGYTGLNAVECEAKHGSFDNGICTQLPARATSVLLSSRRAWLVSPFILILGMFVWYFTVIGKKDPRYFDMVRWK